MTYLSALYKRRTERVDGPPRESSDTIHVHTFSIAFRVRVSYRVRPVQRQYRLPLVESERLSLLDSDFRFPHDQETAPAPGLRARRVRFSRLLGQAA